ncbi:lipopolysaccharide biosynthesis protein [Sphingomonas bacterium]|uniref:lipopolysaccharide biosynthesis protein n=1 Tax=Sphingomonas bacterium TaxID=1895847 RepID=UPI0015775B2F|nr:lipopolysaccharide biosynthesis protein [Sphingomonas bacterium]
MYQIDAGPHQSAESLADRVRRAVIWRSGSQIVAQTVQWAATFLVIRILSPTDYGLFAMTQVVLVLLNMLNGYGLASGLVRQREVSHREVRQLFGMLLLLNGGLAAGQSLLAPLAAAYYRQPIVAELLRVQALLYLATPFIALPQALLGRAMDFRHQAKANICASIASAATALGGALAGWGVWTLVAAPLAMFMVRAVALTIAARSLVWPSFDFRGAGHLARYGGIMAAGQLTWFAQSQADVFIAGRWFTPHVLGLYTTGLFLTQIFVSKFVPPLNEVAFTAYARMQSRPELLAEGFLRAVRVVMLIALPFYLGLAATAGPLVATVLGPKWVEAVPVVRLLALAMPFMTLQILLTPACDARGRPGIGVQNGATGAAILALAFLIAVRWGATALAGAWIVAYPAYLGISLRRSLPIIGTRASDLAAAIGPPVLAASAMALIVTTTDSLMPTLPAMMRLALLVVIGGAGYAGWLAIFARPLLREVAITIGRQPASQARVQPAPPL